MKKKFISLLIIANIILQIFPVYAANVKVNYAEAENVLCALGIYDEKPSGEYVSRSEFFAHFMKALGMSADESNSVALADTTLTGLTALSYNMGYSALFSDNKFHPEKSVTVEEYVKAAIKALNCELALSDGSTNSYMRLAAELELLRGISKSADEAITYEEDYIDNLRRNDDCQYYFTRSRSKVNRRFNRGLYRSLESEWISGIFI